MTKKQKAFRTKRTAARRPRRLPPQREIVLADRKTLPEKRYHALIGGWQQKAVDDSDVRLYTPAPPGFHVSAILRRDESYLWIGVQGSDPTANLPFAIVEGDALRKLVTECVKHFNAKTVAG